jgi:hypothetical protein
MNVSACAVCAAGVCAQYAAWFTLAVRNPMLYKISTPDLPP